MIHTRPHSFVRSITWRSLGALLVAYVSITAPAISGEMYRWLDEQGRVHLTDTPPKSKGALQELKVYQPTCQARLPEPRAHPSLGLVKVKMTSTNPGVRSSSTSMLNRRLTAPMLLDTGADFTVLTKQVARDLRLSSLDHLPTQEFKNRRGVSQVPDCHVAVTACRHSRGTRRRGRHRHRWPYAYGAPRHDIPPPLQSDRRSPAGTGHVRTLGIASGPF